MAMNIMTYTWNKNGKPRRIIDKIAMVMNKLGLFKAHDYCTIEDESNNVVGVLYTIEGSSMVTEFLSWATNYHGKGSEAEIHVNNDGKIIKVNNIES